MAGGPKGPFGAGVQHTGRGPVQGVCLVGPNGQPIDAIDDAGVLRLAVDANVDIDNATINVDLESDTDNVAIRNTANDNELLIQSDGSISVRLRDSSGGAINDSNPLPVQIIPDHTTQIFDENTVGITTATFNNVLTFTATSADTNILLGEVTGPVNALVRLTLNGTAIRMKRINAYSPNIEFRFDEPRRIGVGDIINIDVKPDKAPPAFMAGGADFFASLQGFVQ